MRECKFFGSVSWPLFSRPERDKIDRSLVFNAHSSAKVTSGRQGETTEIDARAIGSSVLRNLSVFGASKRHVLRQS